jgi:hypothetical protein
MCGPVRGIQKESAGGRFGEAECERRDTLMPHHVARRRDDRFGIGEDIHDLKPLRIQQRRIVEHELAAVVDPVGDEQEPDVRTCGRAVTFQFVRLLFDCLGDVKHVALAVASDLVDLASTISSTRLPSNPADGTHHKSSGAADLEHTFKISLRICEGGTFARARCDKYYLDFFHFVWPATHVLQ